MTNIREYRNRRVFITGAAGFIGSHLVEALVEAGAQTRVLVRYTSNGSWGCLRDVSSEVRNSIEVVLGDVRDPQFMRFCARDCDIIFHLAALIGIPYSYQAPQSYTDVNVCGTQNILEAARENLVGRTVITSTSEVYGTACYTPIDEMHPLQAQSPYSASKIAADKLAESYYKSFALPIVTVRPFNTYGPRQSLRALIPVIVSQVLAEVDVLRLGSLTPVRDFTYVSDTVRGFLLAGITDEAVGRVINLGNGFGISVADLARTIMQVSGRHMQIVQDPVRVRPETSEVELLVAKTELARKLLGWRPEISLADGLERVVEYMRNNMRDYRVGTYTV